MEKKISFEIKKKPYKNPNLKKYGSYHEYTKGAGFDGQHADGQVYYGQELRS